MRAPSYIHIQTGELEGGREGERRRGVKTPARWREEGNPIVRKLHFSDQNIAAAPWSDSFDVELLRSPPTSFGYAARILSGGLRSSGLTSILRGYMDDDLMENDLKSFFRTFSSLGNWIMI